MFRNGYLLVQGILLLAILPLLRDVQGGQWTPITSEVTFQCNNVRTDYSAYVVGNHPALGNWDPAKAIPLASASSSTSTSTSTWTGNVLFPGTDDGKDVEWKCILRHNTIPTDVQWQADPNNIVKVTFSIKSVGTF